MKTRSLLTAGVTTGLIALAVWAQDRVQIGITGQGGQGAIAIPDFPAHARDAHGHFAAIRDLLGPNRATSNLFPPEFRDQCAEAQKHGYGEEKDAQFYAGAASREAERYGHR